MVKIQRDLGDNTSVVLEPNHSLSSEAQVFLLLGVFVPAALASVLFFALGAWLVIPFILLEMLILGGMLYLVRLRCATREELLITTHYVAVRKRLGSVSRFWSFDRSHLSLLLGRDETDTLHHVTLCGDGGLVEVGDFLNVEDLQLLLGQLNQQGLRMKAHIEWGYLSC